MALKLQGSPFFAMGNLMAAFVSPGKIRIKSADERTDGQTDRQTDRQTDHRFETPDPWSQWSRYVAVEVEVQVQVPVEVHVEVRFEVQVEVQAS